MGYFYDAEGRRTARMVNADVDGAVGEWISNGVGDAITLYHYIGDDEVVEVAGLTRKGFVNGGNTVSHTGPVLHVAKNDPVKPGQFGTKKNLDAPTRPVYKLGRAAPHPTIIKLRSSRQTPTSKDRLWYITVSSSRS